MPCCSTAAVKRKRVHAFVVICPSSFWRGSCHTRSWPGAVPWHISLSHFRPPAARFQLDYMPDCLNYHCVCFLNMSARYSASRSPRDCPSSGCTCKEHPRGGEPRRHPTPAVPPAPWHTPHRNASGEAPGTCLVEECGVACQLAQDLGPRQQVAQRRQAALQHGAVQQRGVGGQRCLELFLQVGVAEREEGEEGRCTDQHMRKQAGRKAPPTPPSLPACQPIPPGWHQGRPPAPPPPRRPPQRSPCAAAAGGRPPWRPRWRLGSAPAARGAAP